MSKDLIKLIEDCYPYFRSLILHTYNPEKHNGMVWHAKARRPLVGKKFKNQRGETAEEAVENLKEELKRKGFTPKN